MNLNFWLKVLLIVAVVIIISIVICAIPQTTFDKKDFNTTLEAIGALLFLFIAFFPKNGK